MNNINTQIISSLQQLCACTLAKQGVTKKYLLENNYPELIADIVEVWTRIIRNYSILEQIKQILKEMQEKPDLYRIYKYDNIRNTDYKFRLIKNLIREIDDNFITDFKIVITSFTKFGHRYDTNWRLIGINNDKTIHKLGIGYRNRSFFTETENGKLNCNLTMFHWNGDTPGIFSKHFGSNEIYWGWFSDNIIFLDYLISFIKTKFSIKY